MKKNFWKIFLFTMFAISTLMSCATKPYNYENFRKYQPRSILILPPINNSMDVRGTYGYLSTVTLPVAEKGFYVFPVAVVDHMLKENGLPTPVEMQQASLKKISEVLNPDAVMYLTIEQYGTTYLIVDSQTQVSIKGKLVHTRTGTILWEGSSIVVQSGNGNASGLGAIIGAMVSQAVNSTADLAHQVSRTANEKFFNTDGTGLLPGPYNQTQQP